MLTSLYQSDAPVSEIYEAYGDYSNMKWEGLTGFNLTITLGLTCAGKTGYLICRALKIKVPNVQFLFLR